MNRRTLGEVDHSSFICSIEYRRIEHPCAGSGLRAACGVDAQITMQRVQILVCRTGSGTVHGKHPATLAAAKGSVKQIVVKNNHITRFGFKGLLTRQISRIKAKKRQRVIGIDWLRAKPMVRVMATGHNP